MGATLFVRVEGGGQIRRQLRALQRRIGNLRPVLDEIGAAMVSSTQRRFRNGVDPNGTPWPISARAMADDGQTLVDTARLRQSITHRASRTQVEIGTNVIYAAPHQFGMVIKPRGARALVFRAGGQTRLRRRIRMPARPFLGINAADRLAINGIIGDYLAGRVA